MISYCKLAISFWWLKSRGNTCFMCLWYIFSTLLLGNNFNLEGNQYLSAYKKVEVEAGCSEKLERVFKTNNVLYKHHMIGFWSSNQFLSVKIPHYKRCCKAILELIKLKLYYLQLSIYTFFRLQYIFLWIYIRDDISKTTKSEPKVVIYF